jgi:hypothetical protein
LEIFSLIKGLLVIQGLSFLELLLKYWQNPTFLKALTTNRKLLLKYGSGKNIQWKRPVFGKSGNVEMRNTCGEKQMTACRNIAPIRCFGLA